MPRTKKIVTEKVEVTNPDDNPEVVAYRVGALEETVRTGLEKLHDKLDSLRDGFVSHEEMAKYVAEGERVHTDHESRIRTLEEAKNKGLGALATWQQLIVLLGVIAAIIGSFWWVVDLIKHLSGK